METKLKGMKVADLKAVLQQAGVSFTAKLTKPDLIKKIIESPAAAAIASGSENGGPTEDDLPDLPPTTDFFAAPKIATTAPVATPTPAKSAAKIPPAETPKAPAPTPVAGASTQSNTASGSSPPKETATSEFKAPDISAFSVEDEAAKRRARAAKWGTTYIDPLAPSPAKKAASTAVVASTSSEDQEKIAARAKRFGTSKPMTTAAPLNEEEVRKRKSREERFGPNKKPRVEAPANQS